ncbi:MAG TPA: winged helix-turn-helix domain-containing protein [Baekduia sp.]|nr:winged helix-turn-helix domain-containing protein [Baekduia sp.]
MARVPEVRAIVEQIKARIVDIEEQLKQHRDLSEELDRLRGALGRLEGDVTARVRGRRSPTKSSAHTPETATTKRPTPSKTAARAQKPARARSVAPRGQTRAKILEALKDGPKTAGEISQTTGIPRASASTTLNKLAKSGDVVKAERGYKLPT